MPQEALTSFTVSDAYHPFAGHAYLLRSESRSRIGYLIPTNNIIVLDLYFRLTNKSYLIRRFWYDLIRFFIIWSWLTFWGHPVVYTGIREISNCCDCYKWTVNRNESRSVCPACSLLPHPIAFESYRPFHRH